MRDWRSAVGGTVVIGLVVALFVQSCRLADAKEAIRDEGLARANAEARADSSRDAAANNARLAKLLGDSLQAVERLVVQERIRADAIDRALGRVTQAHLALTATVRDLALRNVAGGPVTETPEGTRQADFRVRREPFTLFTRVSLERPPGAARMDTLDVKVDPIPIGPRLQCDTQGTGPAAIRRATVLLTGPPWADLRVGPVQADPNVCNPIQHGTPWFSLGLFGGLGYGLSVHDGETQAGWQATVGVGVVTPLWPRTRPK